jgi:PAS domain S-box-containing protein
MTPKFDQQKADIQAALKESESRYHMVFDNINDGIIIHDTEGRIFDVNQTMYKRLGYTKAEMLDMTLQDLVSPEFAEKIKPRIKQLKEQGVAIFESADKRKDGTYMPVEISTRYVDYKGRKLIQSVVRDIQERKMAENLIAANLDEKEALLEEIQTRAQFDNQIFTEILDHLSNLDRARSWDICLQNHRKRLQILNYLQNKIYRNKNPLRIDFNRVIQDLSRFIFNLYPQVGKKIKIKLELSDTFFNLPTSISCAQIIAELLSNSLRHGFAQTDQGTVKITLHQDQDLRTTMTITDNGEGLSPDFDLNNVDTIGLRVVSLLIQKLKGEISLFREGGATFRIVF